MPPVPETSARPADAAVANDYDSFAEAYSAETEANLINAYYARPAILALAGDVAGRRILDAGCGSGPLFAALRDRGAVVTGVDSSAKMLELARRRLGAGADLQVADLGSPLPFPDGAFDDRSWRFGLLAPVPASSDGHDVDAPTLRHLPYVARVAGDDGDMVLFRVPDRGAEMGVGDGDPCPLPYPGRGVGVLRAEGDVRDPQPVHERPLGRGPVPARLDPDRGGHCDADPSAARRTVGRGQDLVDHAPVLTMRRAAAEGLDRLVVQQDESLHAAPRWSAATLCTASTHSSTSSG